MTTSLFSFRWRLRLFIFGCVAAGYIAGFTQAKGWW